MTDKLLKISQRLIKWDSDFPPNCWNGYAGLKELDAIIADAKVAVHEAGASYEDDLGNHPAPQSNGRASGAGKMTPDMLRDTAGWSQSEDDLRETLRCAADELERALAAAPAPELQVVGEPVAWRWSFDGGETWHYGSVKPEGFRFGDPSRVEPLYSGAASNGSAEYEPWGEVRKGSEGELAIFSPSFNIIKARFTRGNSSGWSSGEILYRRAALASEGQAE